MLLTSFLQDLLTTGSVTLVGRPSAFAPDDLLAATELLQAYYAADAREIPYSAPAFDAPAALWAAGLLYHTVQLTLVRELDEAVIAETLPDFAGLITPEVLYSADLLLRYLPDLLRLAKGLAPGDALVARLQALARQWPLSFGGPELPEPAAEARVLDHPALRQEYVDRLIRAQDRRRAGQPHLRALVQAALGAHAATLWPDFQAFTLVTTDGKHAD
ncbi:hypothetical protein [Hymenobacter chitinivorans]|uniref:MoxR-vWA-beta-propeller ternary system domain-containing protein n=1 Tax=Hymenobacter chitinivorans DSM 11115 TaxID=1121954 RepID=A0A2M9BPV6_9BACT|nr:hypothetical protein [Hymenobacter chitinivorans]PJJ59942.1 hypothetical protein CLV45_1364 [Hymenobacter chitinivorans DSM 11115]